MMKKFQYKLLIIFFFPTFFTSFSQTYAPFQKGSYNSFRSLIEKKPISINFELQLIETEFNRYKLYEIEKEHHFKYAFSDGQSLYLNVTAYTNAYYFIKNEFLFTYIYFEDKIVVDPALMIEKEIGVVLNRHNGEISMLTSTVIEKILVTHPVLFATYETGDKSLFAIKKIIQKLNYKLEKL